MGNNQTDFETWYRELHPKVGTSLAYSFGDVGLAQTSTDEAFTKAFERWNRVSRMESPDAWVYKVAYNHARRRLRRRAFEERLLASQRVDHVEAPAGELWHVVAGLPPRQRQAVVLRHVGQLREREIADAMGISRGAVSATLRSAHAVLRARIGEPHDIPEYQS